MEVYIIEEAGYTEALYGLGLSFGLTSHEDGYAEVGNFGSVRDRLEKRAHMLAGMGKGHDKFLRQIILWVDVKAPLYWWKQLQRPLICENEFDPIYAQAQIITY